MLKCENVTFRYDGESRDDKLILDNINLTIEKGSFTAVLGKNGSGKSTLAKHFNAVLLPCGGNVYVKGVNTKESGHIFDIRKSAGMVFQNPDNQIVATTVEEDVAFGLENLGVCRDEMIKKVDESLKAVGMYEYRKTEPHLLSGGQKQRVAIAGIIAMEPECIVLDEPTAMLDPKGRKEVIKTIRELNKSRNITIVLITHFMEEAAKADRVIVMDDGNVVMDDIPEKIFPRVDEIKAVGLDVPQVVLLCHNLKKMDVDINTDILNTTDCAREIERLLNCEERH